MKCRALPVALLLAWFCAFAAAPETPALANAFYAMDTAFQRPGLDPAQQLALVKQLGFDGIAWHEQPPEEVKAAALAAERIGLRMFTIYCGGQVTPEGGLSYSPSLPALMAALKGHGTLIWLHLGGKGPAIASLSGNEPVVAKLRALAAIAAENDTRIALYPHVGEWTERFGDATRLAKVVNHPALGVTFNLCHCLATGDEKRIPALLEEAAPVLLTATINGADAGVAEPDWSRLIQRLDQGSFDVGAVLRKLDQIGFTGPVGFQGYGLKGSARSILEPTMARWRQPAASLSGSGFHPLFDGKTFAGWEGDTNQTWRLDHGEIVGGSLTAGVPRNEFLCTTRSFTNFVLRLKFKLTGKSGFINAGVQFRSRRVADPPNEMAGYQADIGDPDYWGSIYDEGMRNKTLVKANMDALNQVLRRNDWNEYLIRAEGRRVRLWINGLQTVDYTEPDEQRAQWGIIGLQIHGGAVAEARYKDLVVEELPADPPR
ncbi:MAG TPA: family 16 glycoside hydrolase [Dongiaceae bacterium]|nr:family 16 glycoside hydrolase [Dongiaceae bacterium]